MTSAAFVCGVLVASAIGLGAGVHAQEVLPARSFRLVERIVGPRVISWQASTRAAGGQFVLWRIGADAREVARLDAPAGTHRYRFVDQHAESGGGVLIYRLVYEGGGLHGGSSLLLVATLAERNLRADAGLSAAGLSPEALAPLAGLFSGAPTSLRLVDERGARELFEFGSPKPRPPRG